MRGGLVIALALAACARGPAPAVPVAREGVGAWGVIGGTGEFVVRQQLRFEAKGMSGSFDAVLQVTCQTLTVVGLTPAGTQLFSIRQLGDEVEVTSDAGMRWPFPPERLLLDVHRAFLRPLAAPPSGDGVRVRDLEGLSIIEQWNDGRLFERRFIAGGEAGFAIVEVAYEDGWLPGPLARRTRLQNHAYGYSLAIESVDYRGLPCEGEIGSFPSSDP
jgi:hypothetical protein